MSLSDYEKGTAGHRRAGQLRNRGRRPAVAAAEKAHVGKEIANGVSAIVPIGLVVGVATKTEKAKFEVGTGEYNRMIDKKIAEIKSTCGIK